MTKAKRWDNHETSPSPSKWNENTTRSLPTSLNKSCIVCPWMSYDCIACSPVMVSHHWQHRVLCDGAASQQRQADRWRTLMRRANCRVLAALYCCRGCCFVCVDMWGYCWGWWAVLSCLLLWWFFAVFVLL